MGVTATVAVAAAIFSFSFLVGRRLRGGLGGKKGGGGGGFGGSDDSSIASDENSGIGAGGSVGTEETTTGAGEASAGGVAPTATGVSLYTVGRNKHRNGLDRCTTILSVHSRKSCAV